MLKWVQKSVKGVGRAFSSKKNTGETPALVPQFFCDPTKDAMEGEGRLYPQDSSSKPGVCWIHPEAL